MKRRTPIFLIIFILFLGLTSSAFSQGINISGKIVDKTTNQTMPGATVMLLYPSDSTYYKFGISNTEGRFTINGADAGNYILQISFIGYASFYQNITLTHKNSEVDVGSIEMETRKEVLKAVDVVEEMVPVIINGDTVEFNADAFQTQPESNVGDLLKKLPGVEVEKDGTVKAQGEEVKKVLIDGKEFFGDDTKLATENLPADMVKKVQIYDDFSDASKMTGIDDGDRTKTINLKIKKDRKKGLFGNVTAGGGITATNNFSDEDILFNNKFNINKFKDNMQLSTLGMLNNTNEQGFSYKDYINFSGGIGNAFNRRGNSSGIPMSNNANDGFTTTTAGGVNWNKDLSPKINLSTSYFYNENSKKVYKEVYRQYIADSSNFNSIEKDNETQFSRSHQFKLKYVHKIDSTQDLKIRSNIRYSEGNQFSYASSKSLTPDGKPLNSSNNNNQSIGDDLNGNGSLTYGKRFQKKGRSVVTSFSAGSSKNSKNYFLESDNKFIDPFGNMNSSSIRQLQNENNRQMNYSGQLSYTEPLGNRKYLELAYKRSNYNNDYSKDFFDIPAPKTELYNSSLSQAYNNDYVYDNYKVNTKFNTKKSNLTIGGAAQRSRLDGESSFDNFILTRIQWNVLPSLKWNYSFNKSTRLNVNYSTNVQEPSLDQLQPTINNSDPLFIYQGNPDLLTEYRHNMRIRLMSFNQFSFTNVFAMLNATYTKDKITESQTIDNRFIQKVMPINVDHDYSMSVYTYFGTPIRPIKSKINIRLNSSYNKSILFVNLDKNDVNRFNNGVNLSLENRKKEVIDVKVGAKVSLNTTSYSISSDLNQEYVTTDYYSEFLIQLTKTWTFSTEIEYTLYAGEQFTDNPAIPLWEAHLSKRFLKGNSGLLKLSVYDILNQNIGINRRSEFNYIEDERITTLSRYILLSFTYQIKRFGGKKKKNQ